MEPALWAISPLDGRYKKKLSGLENYASEAALIHYRTYVELSWFKHLSAVDQIRADFELTPEDHKTVDDLLEKARQKNLPVEQVKDIENTTNHDVKAVEYFLQKKIAKKSLHGLIHFACTSEDINNLSYGLMLSEIRRERLVPLMDEIIRSIGDKATSYRSVAMLSRTHGQTASPTTLGKELAVFARRLKRQKDQFAAVSLQGKINGAVGNFNAHYAAYPNLNWLEISQTFIEDVLGLEYNPLTTQIENHDSVAEYLHALSRFHSILLDCNRDLWGYISLGYFKLALKDGEIGSSTMPHKVNPIDFENSEGNLGIVNSLCHHLGEKLLVSRWQRDLSDSTVLRSLGSVAGYSELAMRSFLSGLNKLEANKAAIAEDLDQAWEVLAEPIQTVMRRFGVSDAYERLKEATRGKTVTKEALHLVIDSCEQLPNEHKKHLKQLTPALYTGVADKLVDFID